MSRDDAVNSEADQRRLVLARHGESESNAANLFTGWADPPLTMRGEDEARAIAEQLAGVGIQPDCIFSSALRRSVRTADLVAQTLGRPDLTPIVSPALNERDYGSLTGLNKAQAADRFGAEQITRWRRSWAEAPPEGESLRDTAARFLPYYLHTILPQVMREQQVLVIAHGNSLRALSMALEGLTPRQVETLEFPTGGCRIYLLAPDTSVLNAELLEDGATTPIPIAKETLA